VDADVETTTETEDVWRVMLQDVAEALMQLRHLARKRGEGRIAELCAPLVLELLEAQAAAVPGRENAEKGADPSAGRGQRTPQGTGRERTARRGGKTVEVRLTARERECLRWCAAGKTYWETAIILGISERTVDFHMQSARRKLRADSNAACVARALLLGLI
jgi:DNA-binding CsgD family transcriptional regulator